MKCTSCDSEDSKVVDSRSTEEGNAIRRRRECNECNFRWTTYEKIEIVPIMVIKRNKVIQEFDREKMKKGILSACVKRPVTVAEVEKIVDEIESDLKNSMVKEITSKELGEKVMKKLKTFDEVAYVRFASVYRQFKDVSTFLSEINDFIKTNKNN